MSIKLIFFLYFTGRAAKVYGFSLGVPASDHICKFMTPMHPGQPQTSPVPYKLQLDKTQVAPGCPVFLTISGYNPMCRFKGFFVQGRRLNRRSGNYTLTPMGRFSISTNVTNVQKTVDCGHPGGAVCHKDGNYKSSVSLKWVAPEQHGTYVLLTTIVKDEFTYWVRIRSEEINVI